MLFEPHHPRLAQARCLMHQGSVPVCGSSVFLPVRRRRGARPITFLPTTAVACPGRPRGPSIINING
jgi:hypothetical protein